MWRFGMSSPIDRRSTSILSPCRLPAYVVLCGPTGRASEWGSADRRSKDTFLLATSERKVRSPRPKARSDVAHKVTDSPSACPIRDTIPVLWVAEA